MSSVAVVDSGVANFASVTAAIARLGAEAEVTSDPNIINKAQRVIVPGVGAAAAAMAHFNAKNLGDTLRNLTQPVLGICLGMQLMFERSLEGREPVLCLGILPGEVKPLKPAGGLPVPHMGWNQIVPVKPSEPLLQGVKAGDYVYFVHGFAAPVTDITIASADYGGAFSAVVAQRNFFGCQFHPERSSIIGAQILKNFLNL